MPSLFVVLRVAERSHLRFYAEVLVSTSNSTVQEAASHRLPKHLPKMMRAPDLVFAIDAYELEPLLLPKPNGAWQERMRVEVHALDACCERALLQRLEQRRGETTPSVPGQHE